MTLYELKRDTEFIKNKLQTLVSENSYDDLIRVCQGDKIDNSLICALGELENALVEMNAVKYKL